MGRLIVFSGAGLSAESGLATFRSKDGLWSKQNLDRVCNYMTWKSNLAEVHAFYNQRRAEVGAAEPNAAHRMIAAWQQRYRTVIITQNVDDLLERAGCTDVVHLHGHIQEMHCTACGRVWGVGYAAWADDSRCECGCRKGVKPNVVFFHQEAPNYRILEDLIDSLEHTDIFVVTGTSGTVVTIDEYLYDRKGFKIYNGLEPARIPYVYDISVLLPATEAFLTIDRILQERPFASPPSE